MKQLGNLALVCANRSDVLLQIQRGTVCFSIGMGTQMETMMTKKSQHWSVN